jgi:hypothetical protein
MPVIGWLLGLGFCGCGTEDLSVLGCYMALIFEWFRHFKRTSAFIIRVKQSKKKYLPFIPEDCGSFTLKHVSVIPSICTPKIPSVT